MSATVHTIANSNGLKLSMTTLGGKIMSLYVPDKNGVLSDIVLGYDRADQYLTGNPFFGAMIGRYGNRISKGRFSLAGKNYQLRINNGVNSLHGGRAGFHNVMWRVEPVTINGNQTLELYYFSKDMEEGFPGNLKVKVTYSLTDQNELVIDYEATTDKTTVINLTHHSFFNLAGADNGDVLDHLVEINSERFCAIDSALIPTGELKKVDNTAFDFRKAVKIGERINDSDEQLRLARGYDHNWVLAKNGIELSFAARVTEPKSGRVMEVWTTEPGLQFYSGNFLDGTEVGKDGVKYGFRSALCLEAQHFPDSPNHSEFPTTVLKPGETYNQKTIYKFSVE
ncbi:MAG: galactose mutarotase [Cyclobacteriaceae bacterium]|nr:galactose mutarotase [Cyclobacteriaceae bacterium]